MVERMDPDRIFGVSGEDLDIFLDGDVKIRSGLCPNGHGLLAQDEHGQRCPTCKFFTNVMPELDWQ